MSIERLTIAASPFVAVFSAKEDVILPLEDQASTLQTVKEPNLTADEGPNENTNKLAAEENRTTNVTEEEPPLESPEKAGSGRTFCWPN